MIYFTSDTHYGHANILKYCDRPWSTVEEMDDGLISNWNSVVQKTDTVYHLGDFTFYRDPEKVKSIIRRLNGDKYFIWGNHDKVMREVVKYAGYFIWDKDYYELKTPGNPTIVLMHYPILVWNGAHRGAIQLHGHDHGGVDYLDNETTRMDVGVDAVGINYFPVSLDQVMSVMKKRNYKPMDQHGSDQENM